MLTLIFRHNIRLSLSFSITASNLLLALESGVEKLEGRTSQYQAFAYAIAGLLIPALLNLAHLHRPVALPQLASVSTVSTNTMWRFQVGLCRAMSNVDAEGKKFLFQRCADTLNFEQEVEL